MSRARTVAVCLLLALLAAAPRAIILMRHRNDYFVDQGLYWSTGKLTANGVNVYDYSDNEALRREIFDHHKNDLHWPFAVGRTQAQWDYYTAGNLPLTTLLFGAIYDVNSSPTAFQVAFLLFDILIAPLAFLLIRRDWHLTSPWVAGALAFALGTNMALLKWGSIFPEDKGLQTVLILGTLLICARQTIGHAASWARLVAGAAIAALSVSFKGMGIFFLPAVLVWAWRERGKRGVAVSLAVLAAVGLAINGPYLLAIVRLASRRMGIDTSSGPNHSSIWALLGPQWDRVAWLHPNVLLSVAGAAWVTALLYRGRIGLRCWGAACCTLLNVVLLVGGSLDRVLMGVMPLIITLGFERPSWGVTSVAIWSLICLPLQRAEDETRDRELLAGAVALVAVAFAAGVPALLERRCGRWIPKPRPEDRDVRSAGRLSNTIARL
jgi:hypothetical protein